MVLVYSGGGGEHSLVKVASYNVKLSAMALVYSG